MECCHQNFEHLDLRRLVTVLTWHCVCVQKWGREKDGEACCLLYRISWGSIGICEGGERPYPGHWQPLRRREREFVRNMRAVVEGTYLHNAEVLGQRSRQCEDDICQEKKTTLTPGGEKSIIYYIHISTHSILTYFQQKYSHIHTSALFQSAHAWTTDMPLLLMYNMDSLFLDVISINLNIVSLFAPLHIKI